MRSGKQRSKFRAHYFFSGLKAPSVMPDSSSQLGLQSLHASSETAMYKATLSNLECRSTSIKGCPSELLQIARSGHSRLVA